MFGVFIGSTFGDCGIIDKSIDGSFVFLLNKPCILITSSFSPLTEDLGGIGAPSSVT